MRHLLSQIGWKWSLGWCYQTLLSEIHNFVFWGFYRGSKICFAVFSSIFAIFKEIQIFTKITISWDVWHLLTQELSLGSLGWCYQTLFTEIGNFVFLGFYGASNINFSNFWGNLAYFCIFWRNQKYYFLNI